MHLDNLSRFSDCPPEIVAGDIGDIERFLQEQEAISTEIRDDISEALDLKDPGKGSCREHRRKYKESEGNRRKREVKQKEARRITSGFPPKRRDN